MTIVEQLARYLAGRMGLAFEGGDAGGAVFFGCLPERPVRAVCAYAGDLRAGGDPDGTRVQIAVRSDRDCAWPLERAAEITRLLDGRRDLIFTPAGGYVNRVELERGFEYAGMEDDGAQLYTADFRVYWC